MKAFISAVILLIILIGTAFLSSHILVTNANQLVAQAEMLSQATDCEKAVTHLQREWERQRFAFSLMTNRNELDVLELAFARVQAAAEAKSDDDFLIAADELTNSLSRLRDLYVVSWDNIL